MNLYPWKESGNPEWNVAEDGVKWSQNCDFDGHDIGPTLNLVDGGLCGRKCIDTKGCNAFWSKGGSCSLKNIPQGLRRKHFVGGVCGIIPWKF